MTVRKRMISGLLAGILVFGAAAPVDASGLKEAEQKKRQLEQQKKEAESEKTSLSAKLNTIVAEMKQTEEKLVKKEKEIEKAEEELVRARVEEQTQYSNMKKRIKYMYENGSTELFQMLFESKSMADFLNKAEYATKVSEYDRDMLKRLQKLVKKVEEAEEKLQEEYKNLHAIQDDLTAKQAEVEKLLAENAAAIHTLDTQMGEVEQLIANAKEAERRQREAQEAQRREEARRRQQSQQANQSTSGERPKPPVVSGTGYFTHPCPAMSYQSSYFGEVRQGIGDSRAHKGHDYAAPQGTPIYAAAAGRVVTAGYSNSAGYWVVINHENGLVTKYMHMYTTPLVSAGQYVSKGQHIGGVGTTGQSTGNHLHFQVELNGVAVNPSNYM